MAWLRCCISDCCFTWEVSRRVMSKFRAVVSPWESGVPWLLQCNCEGWCGAAVLGVPLLASSRMFISWISPCCALIFSSSLETCAMRLAFWREVSVSVSCCFFMDCSILLRCLSLAFSAFSLSSRSACLRSAWVSVGVLRSSLTCEPLLLWIRGAWLFLWMVLVPFASGFTAVKLGPLCGEVRCKCTVAVEVQVLQV